MKCMLLAAGLGTRLRPVTNKVAKPAVELLNVPLFYYSVELLLSISPEQVVVNCHHHPEQIENLASRIPYETIMSYEAQTPLGSGGGLKQAEEVLARDNFMVLNADNVVIPANADILKNLWSCHLAGDNPLATLLTIEDPRAGQLFNGVWFNSKGELREVAKIPSNQNWIGRHFTGIAVYSPRIFDYLPMGESNIFDSLLKAIQGGEKVQAYEEPLNWFETGDPKNFLATAETLLQHFESTIFLQNIVSKYAPDSIFQNTGTSILLTSQSANIASDVVRKGFVIIGSQTEIKGGCTFENSVVLSHARPSSGLTFRNQIVV